MGHAGVQGLPVRHSRGPHAAAAVGPTNVSVGDDRRLQEQDQLLLQATMLPRADSRAAGTEQLRLGAARRAARPRCCWKLLDCSAHTHQGLFFVGFLERPVICVR